MSSRRANASPSSQGTAVACNVALAALYLTFAAAQVHFARTTGEWGTTLPLVAQETLLVVLLLVRRRSGATSDRVRDWIVGMVAVALPLGMRSAEPLGPLAAIGRPVQLAALVLSIGALGSLGRSVGIVAADRGVKTTGAYRFARHPMYACHVVSYAGFVACYPTVGNTLLATAATLAQLARGRIEERFLARDPSYRRYLRHVPWRFVPGLY